MKRRASGFSLLEVVVALAVLALSFGVLFRVFGQSLGNIGRGEQYSRAAAVAEAQLAALGAVSSRRLRSYEADVDDGFHVVVTVTPPKRDGRLASLPVKPYRISVRVAWDRAGRSGELTVDTIRLGRAE